MENVQNNKQTKEKKNLKRVILVLLFLVVVSLFLYVNTRGEYLQMQELGEQYVTTYMEKFQYKAYTFAIVTFVAYLAIYMTTVFIKKGLKKFFVTENKQMPKLPNKSISLIFGIIISLIISPILAEKFMLLINPSYFGIADPIFNMDIGYYIFIKPFIELLLISLAIFVVGISIYIGVYYIIAFNTYFDGIDLEMLKKSTFMKQLITNAIIFAVILGMLVFIKSHDILFTNFISNDIETGLTILGAGFMDVTIKLWAYRILAVIIVLSVCLTLYYVVKANKKRAVVSILMVPAFLICLFILSILYNIIFVRSNEFDKEKQYISYNISNTKRAYNINIEENTLDYSGTLTLNEIENNQDVLKNIPIIDENITLTTLKEYQSNVGFYSFDNVHIANYNNSLQYVTPREILTSGTISNTSKIYEYTHGYSTIITSAVDTDEYGNVKYIQSDFDSKNNSIKITEPRIYFGLQTRDNIIVNTNNQEEYDYPITTTTNATNHYDGKAGLSLNFWDRFILGLKVSNMNIAFGIDMNENSKILVNRQIRERAKMVLPEIMYDENPYLVITDEGRLVWVIDGYTTSNQYPYSTSVNIEYEGIKQDINYIRNSVKVLIDAYDGTMKFYITDRDDPIIMAYNKIHPHLFVDANEAIPEDIQKHFVYPEYLYKIQSRLLTSYHDVQPEVLYRNDDIWEVATYYQTIGTTGKTTKIDPYYIMVNDNGPRLGLVLPYTKYNKKNINAYLVATYDNNGNPKLKLYKFNANSNVLGPTQLESQIEEDETISAELKTISVTGTRLLKNTLIIPVENTVLYVEPIYQLRLNETQIPVLKKIIVASGNKLAIGDNIKEALDNLLSQYAVNIDIENTEDIEGLIQQIIKANNNLKGSSANSDWELMGKDVKRLQELITQLEQIKKEENTIDNTIAGNTIGNNIISNSFNNIIE